MGQSYITLSSLVLPLKVYYPYSLIRHSEFQMALSNNFPLSDLYETICKNFLYKLCSTTRHFILDTIPFVACLLITMVPYTKLLNLQHYNTLYFLMINMWRQNNSEEHNPRAISTVKGSQYPQLRGLIHLVPIRGSNPVFQSVLWHVLPLWQTDMIQIDIYSFYLVNLFFSFCML